MSTPLATRRQAATTSSVRPSVRTFMQPAMEESPFQPYARWVRDVHVLKPEAIEPMANWWATFGWKAPNPNDAFAQALERYPEMFETYSLLSAFDRSLMLPGHQNLVMHLVKDPTQIPDRPPASVTERLLLAERMFPNAGIYYVEPVFAISKDPGVLPVPMTEEAFMLEAGRRILQAQALAKRWSWYHETCNRINTLAAKYAAWSKAYKEARVRAEMMEVSEIVLRQRADWTLQESLKVMRFRSRTLSRLLKERETDTVRSLSMQVELDTIMRRLDPLLLIEMPNKPKEFGLIGHWYWHKVGGKETLHLHLVD